MIRYLILLFSFAFLCSCAGTQSGTNTALRSRADQAVLTVYLSASGAAELDVKLRLEDVAIDVDGVWVDLGLKPVDIDFLQSKGAQVLLGAAVAPVGEHRNLRLRVSNVTSGTDGGNEQLFQLTLPDPMELRRGDSKCLFLDWQLVSEQPGSKKYVSQFNAWGQGQTLGGELLYVASQNINTVYLIRMDINEVVSAFGVPGPLADIRLYADQHRLYILSTGRRSIYVYDCLNARLIDQISLPGSLSPQHMALSPDGSFAYVSDSDAGAVFKVALTSGSLVAQVRTGHRPQRLISLPEGQERLAVAVPNSHQVFILSAEDLKVQRSIPVGLRPAGLLYFDNSLYVAESGSQSVAVFDDQTGRQTAKIAVGLRPDYLLSVDRNSAYVSNSGEASLTALNAGQNTAFKRIRAGNNPSEMVFSERKHLLYVGNPAEHSVTVIDRVSENVIKQIDLGGPPKSMAVLE